MGCLGTGWIWSTLSLHIMTHNDVMLLILTLLLRFMFATQRCAVSMFAEHFTKAISRP